MPRTPLGELTTLSQTLELVGWERDTPPHSLPPRRLWRLILDASGTEPISGPPTY